MEYLIELGLALFATIVLFFTLKRQKVLRIVLILVVLLGVFAHIGLTYYFEEPEIELLGDKKVEIEVQGQYVDNGAKAMYHFEDVTPKIKIKGEVDISKVGTYKVEYEITCNNKTTIAERVVEVVDNTAPTITLQGEEQVCASSIELYQEAGYVSEDNYDGTLTDKVEVATEQVSENLYRKVYSVTDSSGNVAKVARMVEIKDIVAPTITLKGKSSQTIYQGGSYSEAGATATDDLDGDISANIQIVGSVDSNKTGTYKIKYTVADKSGNSTTVERTVTVVQKVTNASQGSNAGAGGMIYLTFDDGPSTSITPKILDILKSENVKATFFILNYSSSTEYIVKRIVNEGHTIAIHGYSHDYNQIYKSVDAYMQNLSTLRQKIKNSTGVDTTITRFPGGSSNTVSKFNPGIMTILTQKVVAEGYRYFDWNVDSNDAGGAKSSQEIYKNVTSGLRKSRSNVVLMHDLSGKEKTLNALRDIIHYGKNNGYTFDKITKSTPMVTHRVNN